MATPDGRLSETTFADASMSAFRERTKTDLTPSFESATGWDHSQSQNSQMNLKIHPNAIKGDIGTKHLADLAQSYLRRAVSTSSLT